MIKERYEKHGIIVSYSTVTDRAQFSSLVCRSIQLISSLDLRPVFSLSTQKSHFREIHKSTLILLHIETFTAVATKIFYSHGLSLFERNFCFPFFLLTPFTNKNWFVSNKC